MIPETLVGMGKWYRKRKKTKQGLLSSEPPPMAVGPNQTGEPRESAWKVSVRVIPLRGKGQGLTVGVLIPWYIESAQCVDVQIPVTRDSPQERLAGISNWTLLHMYKNGCRRTREVVGRHWQHLPCGASGQRGKGNTGSQAPALKNWGRHHFCPGILGHSKS